MRNRTTKNEVASVLLFTDGQANEGYVTLQDITRAMVDPDFAQVCNPKSTRTYRSNKASSSSHYPYPSPISNYSNSYANSYIPPPIQQQQQQFPSFPPFANNVNVIPHSKFSHLISHLAFSTTATTTTISQLFCTPTQFQQCIH